MYSSPVSTRPRERRLLNRHMIDLLEKIERLEQAAQYGSATVATQSGDQVSATGSAIETTLVELRSQLQAMMQEAIALEREMVDPEAEDADGENSGTAGDHGAGARAAPPWGHLLTPAGPEAGQPWTAPTHRPDGLSIRVIPPDSAEAETAGASRSLTLVFDLGASQPPVRVSLPVDATLTEQKASLPPPEHAVRARPSRSPMLAGVVVALLLVTVGFLGALWAGALAPTATSQPDRTAPAAVPTALPEVGGDVRVLRDGPTLDASVLTKIANGTRVEVLDGVEFADGYAWLRVRTSDGWIGWVASSAQGATSDTPAPPTTDTESS